MSSPRLPVLLLPHPLILLPTARLTFPVSRALAEAILTLLDDSEAAQPLLAAIPLPGPSEGAGPDGAFDVSSAINSLPTYGTAARVVRLVRPRTSSSPGAPRQPYLLSLHGLTRIRLASPLQMDTTSLDTLPLHKVLYPSAEGTPSRETVEAFKDAALSLLDRLAKDSVQPQRKDDWLRIAGIVEDISQQRAAWMADVLVAAVSGQYGDKLGQSLTARS
jgi:ATP-dependent Lon protease